MKVDRRIRAKSIQSKVAPLFNMLCSYESGTVVQVLDPDDRHLFYVACANDGHGLDRSPRYTPPKDSGSIFGDEPLKEIIDLAISNGDKFTEVSIGGSLEHFERRFLIAQNPVFVSRLG